MAFVDPTITSGGLLMKIRRNEPTWRMGTYVLVNLSVLMSFMVVLYDPLDNQFSLMILPLL